MATTYAEIRSAIADDIDDTTGEYAAQIADAVLTAIRYCERSTYYFNQTRDVTFQTVVGQQWYDASDNANIGSLVKAQVAFFVDPAGNVTDMTRVPPVELEILGDNSAASGEPTLWAYFGQRIRLYPVPDGAYTIRLQLSPYRLVPLVEDGDTNAWLTEAYDMVKARAKYVLYKDTLKDANLAAEALNDFNDNDSALTAETSKRNGTGRIRPTDF